MNKMKIVSYLIVILSLVLLVPGLFKPVLSLSMTTEIKTKIASFSAKGFEKDRSILGTVKDLHEDKRTFVAFLILLFSVLIPFMKILLFLVALQTKKVELKKKIFNILDNIGKWSMADVFVVAIFIAFLSTDGLGQVKIFDVTLLGMILPVELRSAFHSSPGSGFYYFLSYCLLSIASLHFVKAYIRRSYSE